MNKITKLIFCTLSLFIIGCSSAGSIKNIQDRETVSQLRTGVTTQKDVYELFGEPTHRGTKPEGETWWAYYYAKGAGEGASLSIDFDENGRVKSFNYIP